MGQQHYMQGFENTEGLGQIWLEFDGLAADQSSNKTRFRTLVRIETKLLTRCFYKALVERKIKARNAVSELSGPLNQSVGSKGG